VTCLKFAAVATAVKQALAIYVPCSGALLATAALRPVCDA